MSRLPSPDDHADFSRILIPKPDCFRCGYKCDNYLLVIVPDTLGMSPATLLGQLS